MNADWQAVWLTIALAGVTTVVLIFLAAPLAWWLANTASRSRAIIESLVAMPLVLPLSLIHI